MVSIMIEDGFEIPTMISELIKIDLLNRQDGFLRNITTLNCQSYPMNLPILMMTG